MNSNRTFTLAHKLIRLTEAEGNQLAISLILKFDKMIQAHFEENEKIEAEKAKRQLEKENHV